MNKWLFTFLEAIAVFTIIIGCSFFLMSYYYSSYGATGMQELIYFFFGLILGLGPLIKEIEKSGKWSLNLPRLLFFGLPCLFLVIYGFLVSSFFLFAGKVYQAMPYSFMPTEPIGRFAQVALGFLLLSSFEKKTPKETRKEL
jgi:hypothetical protein